MSSHPQFGKRPGPSVASAADCHEIDGHSFIRGSSVFSAQTMLIIAFIAILVPGAYVWSGVAEEKVHRLPEDKAPNRLMDRLTERYEGIVNELTQNLGERPTSRQKPNLESAVKFANNLPSRFEQITRELAAASGRKGPSDGTAGIKQLPRVHTVEPHELGLTEILKLSNHAKSQFANINRILGVRSASKNSQGLVAGVDRLMEVLSVDWSALRPAERERVIRDANSQAAFVFRNWLPVATEIAGVTLFAIDPAGTTLRYSYRSKPSQPKLDLSRVRGNLNLQVCKNPITRVLLRYGGQFEFMFYGAEEQIIQEFSLSQSSCS